MNPHEIKGVRSQKKMTQEAFAEWLGYSKHAVISWENGRNKVPDAVVKRIRADKPVLNPVFSLSEFQRMQEVAREEGLSLDEWIAKIIKASLKLLIFFALCASLFRWAESGDPVTGAMMGVADAVTFAAKAAHLVACCGVELVRAFC